MALGENGERLLKLTHAEPRSKSFNSILGPFWTVSPPISFPLPALCRKTGIPCVIVKGKARLGAVVGRKTSAVLAFGEVKSEDKAELAKLVSAIKANYEEKYASTRNFWGGGIRGHKSIAKLEGRAKALGHSHTV